MIFRSVFIFQMSEINDFAWNWFYLSSFKQMIPRFFFVCDDKFVFSTTLPNTPWSFDKNSVKWSYLQINRSKLVSRIFSKERKFSSRSWKFRATILYESLDSKICHMYYDFTNFFIQISQCFSRISVYPIRITSVK